MVRPDSHTTQSMVDHLFRSEAGKMTAILTRIFGFQHSDLIEDIVQETFLSALKTWPLKGQPDNPSAWLMQVAKNKAINTIKRDNRLQKWTPEIEEDVDRIDRLFLDHEIKDSQLRMLFACCYPELHQKQQIMLMLKTMCGFSNTEIGYVLLMSPAAVKKAIYRAKKKVQTFYNSITVPVINEARQRLETVYMAIYLMFTEGYKRSYEDQVISEDICFEAARLATLLLDIPEVNHGKTHALLSLIFFNMARFPARVGSKGEIIDLKLQDRSLWNQKSIDAGFHHLQLSRESSSLSRFHLESSIASIHCSATRYEETDWERILYCYRRLLQLVDSGIIRLNLAIVLGKVEGPEAGLQALEEVELASKHMDFMIHAAKADMHAELGKYEMAKSHYLVACDMAHSKADKHYLRSKIEECDRKNISDN